MNDSVLKIIIVVTKIEFLLILFFALLIFMAFFFMKLKKRLLEKKEIRLRRNLIRAIEEEKAFSPALVPKRMGRYEILIVVENLNGKFNDRVWNSLKVKIVEKYLLSLARKWALSKSFFKNDFAARTFSLFCEKEDEDLLIHLLKNGSSLIRMSAAVPAGAMGTMRLLQALVEVMVGEREEGRYAFIDAVLEGNPRNLGWAREQLKLEKEAKYRIVYFELLSQKFDSNLIPYLLDDLEAKNNRLRLKALKLLDRLASPIGKEKLLRLLKDPFFEIRAEAVKILGNLFGLEEKEHMIKSLHDEIWWVRLHAALALKAVGEEGREILLRYSKNRDSKIFETVQYALSLPD